MSDMKLKIKALGRGSVFNYNVEITVRKKITRDVLYPSAQKLCLR